MATARDLSETDMDFLLEVGERVKALRVRAGYSLREVGEQLGFTFSWPQKVEGGTLKMSIVDLMHLSQVLRVPPDFILGRGTSFRPETLADFRLLFSDDLVATTLWTVFDALANARVRQHPMPQPHPRRRKPLTEQRRVNPASSTNESNL